MNVQAFFKIQKELVFFIAILRLFTNDAIQSFSQETSMMDVSFSLKKKVFGRFLSFFQELMKKMLTKI